MAKDVSKRTHYQYLVSIFRRMKKIKGGSTVVD